MNTVTRTLTPTPPFDFARTLAVLARFQADGVYKRVGANSLTQAFRVGDGPVLVELSSTGTVERPELRAVLTAPDALRKKRVERVLEHLRWYLGLDDDLTPFYAHARRDDAFRPVLEQLYGYHQVKFPTLFTCLCWALVTQRTPNSFAFKTMAALSETLGSALSMDGETYTVFPEPSAFLDPDAPPLVLAATNNTRKTERLLPLARALLAEDETFLRTAPYDEVYSRVKTFPGLGDWSVQYVMLRGLGRYERSPWTDTWLLEGVSRAYTGGLSISRGDAAKLAESYGWYQGLWVHYLKTALL